MKWPLTEVSPRPARHWIHWRTPALVAALLVARCLAMAQQAPSASLQELGANNTSAAAAVNGVSLRAAGFDLGAVSKVPLRSLLDGEPDVRFYAHVMPWFGSSKHLNVGYDSASGEQVRRQIDDMLSRGFSGLIVYWTGPPHDEPSSHTHHAVVKIMQEAERHAGFQFAVQEDKQGLKECAQHGCDLTGELARHLQVAAKTFFDSPAYLRVKGRPVLFFFGLEEYAIDWNRVRASVPGEPLFIFRNSVGFGYAGSDGAFAWNATKKDDPTDIGLDYLERFYGVAGQHSGAVSIGSVYAGFNDELASWGKHRVIPRNCGDTWLRTFEEARRHRGSFSALQVVTWNDYEEGSQIETGIDNCLNVRAFFSGALLRWSISGSEKTVHHFALWSSGDGRQFRRIAEAPANARSFELSGLSLPPGSYNFVVQAVGQPSMLNHLSEVVRVSIPGL